MRERLVKVDAANPEQVAQARAVIRLLYKANNRTHVRKNVRLRELETVFAYVWRGTELPDDDAGRDCLWIAACHLWYLGMKRGADAAITEWAIIWAPWCGPEELAALIERVSTDSRKWTADELAEELGYMLPFSVRQVLNLTTIGSFDLDKQGRKERRAANKKANCSEWRRGNGAVPRAEYLAANTASRDEPWVPLGISRPTYYRRLKAQRERETSPNTPNKGNELLHSDQSHGAERPKRDGAEHRLIAIAGEICPPLTGGSAMAAPPPTIDPISPLAAAGGMT